MGQRHSYISEAVAPWRPFNEVIKMQPHELSEYYENIWNDPKGLTPLQKHVVLNHIDDLRAASHCKGPLQLARRSPVYAIFRYAWIVSTLLVRTFVANPSVPFTNPVDWALSLVAYAVVFVALLVVQAIFTIGYLLGIGRLIGFLSDRYGNGQGLVTIAAPEFYTKKAPIFAAAAKVLSSAAPKAPKPPGLSPDGSLGRSQRTKKEAIVFNVDVAKAMVVLCTIVYDRDDQYVKLACDYPEQACKFLLRSEELMFAYSRVWGLDFVSISDFVTVSGPFASAFYKIRNLGPDEHPFIVITLKGTSPTNIAEWATDGTLNFEDAGETLGAGLAHDGFHSALFPDDGYKGLVKAPYDRIVETVRLIASQVEGTNKKTQIFVTGHSLGAGMASVLYARLIASPQDLGDQCELRDVYMFGTPRALDAEASSRFDFNLRQPVNYNRMAFRVCNRSAAPIVGDIVCRVPPGMCDQRSARSTVQRGSLLSYAAVGIQVVLRPHMGSPFYSLGPIPVGWKVRVEANSSLADYGFELARSAGRLSLTDNPVAVGDWFIKALLPFVHDHYPTEYYNSLCALQVRLPARNQLALGEGDTDPEAAFYADLDKADTGKELVRRGPPGSGTSASTNTSTNTNTAGDSPQM